MSCNGQRWAAACRGMPRQGTTHRGVPRRAAHAACRTCRGVPHTPKPYLVAAPSDGVVELRRRSTDESLCAMCARSKKLDDVGLSDSTVTDSGKRERKWETQKILSWSPEVTICKTLCNFDNSHEKFMGFRNPGVSIYHPLRGWMCSGQ